MTLTLPYDVHHDRSFGKSTGGFDMPYNILYIEDNPLNIRLIQRSLKHLPVTIDVAFDGDEGLKKIYQKRPDMVLLDINLPTIGGIDVLVHLKTNKLTRDIPVIALTADSTLQTRKLCETYGVVDFLQKPISRSSLIQSIQTVMADLEIASNQ